MTAVTLMLLMSTENNREREKKDRGGVGGGWEVERTVVTQ